MPGKRLPKKAKPSVLAEIDSSTIIKRLKKHGLTHPGKRYFVAEYMQPSQVTALLGLLKKTVPDLASHQVEVDVEGEIIISWQK